MSGIVFMTSFLVSSLLMHGKATDFSVLILCVSYIFPESETLEFSDDSLQSFNYRIISSENMGNLTSLFPTCTLSLVLLLWLRFVTLY